MTRSILVICAALLLVCAALFLWVVCTNLNFQQVIRQRESMNKRLEVLRDRARATPPDSNALSTLVSTLRSPDRFERTAAISFLGQVGSNAAPAVGALVDALNNGDPFMAREAANSLGEIGQPARQAIKPLLNAVKQHDDSDIGWFAADALGHIAGSNDTEVITVLTRAAGSSDQRMRFSATNALQVLQGKP